MGWGQLVVGPPGSGKTTYCDGARSAPHSPPGAGRRRSGGAPAPHLPEPERG